MPVEDLHHVCAAGWASPLPLPFWSTAKGKSKGKVRLVGRLDALYLEQRRLVLEIGQEDPELIWIFYDEETRWNQIEPGSLQVGNRLQVDGFLQGNGVQARRISSVKGP